MHVVSAIFMSCLSENHRIVSRKNCDDTLVFFDGLLTLYLAYNEEMIREYCLLILSILYTGCNNMRLDDQKVKHYYRGNTLQRHYIASFPCFHLIIRSKNNCTFLISFRVIHFPSQRQKPQFSHFFLKSSKRPLALGCAVCRGSRHDGVAV